MNALLTLLIFVPLLGALLLLPLRGRDCLARMIALAIATVETLLAASAWLCQSHLPVPTAPAGFFLFEDFPWIEAIGVRYTLGMDGISLLLVTLTAIVTVIAMLVSWRSIDKRVSLH
jgi:NADH-quinone oxidoreductase subunit M